jgi:hypothetical protein
VVVEGVAVMGQDFKDLALKGAQPL